MKNILVSIILIVAFCHASAQLLNKTDLQNLNLKDKVKSLRETSYKAVKTADGVIKGKKKMESPDTDRDYFIVFNDKGFITERAEYNSDGSFYQGFALKYNSDGKIVEFNNKSADGSIIYTDHTTYLHNTNGQVIEETVINKKDSVIQKYKYAYDAKGNIIEKIGQFSKESDGWKMTYKYDENENIIEEVWSNLDGIIQQRTTKKFDNNHNCTEENIFEKGDKFLIKYFRRYDDKGNQTEIEWCKENGKSYRKYTSKYEYDTNGNWIRQIQFDGDKPLYLLEREVTYYSI